MTGPRCYDARGRQRKRTLRDGLGSALDSAFELEPEREAVAGTET
ncbi:MAG: hypothetical protein NZ898_07695 [Myxococcota bacterium]|nr:hypothetical protein [Myxococcota bacterium]MDW8363017.1 hypothetical protein [Myxococcales bacterium]